MKTKKKFSLRETLLFIILGLLVFGLCYYKFFYMNIQDQIGSLKANEEFELTQTETLSSRVAAVNAMRESVDASKSGLLTEPIPEYDNSKNVIKELNRILAATESYSLNFATLNRNDYIVERPISIKFKSGSYSQARAIVSKLDASGFFNQISDVSYTAEKGNFDEDGNYNAPFNVSLTITYFEVDG